MNKSDQAEHILEQYRKGQRYFSDLDLSNENFDGQNLQDIIFEDCFLYSSFKNADLRNSKFINGNIKTCDFRGADLTFAHFENVAVEGTQFAGSKIDGIYFDNCWAYGQKVTRFDFDDWLKDYEE